MGKGEGWGCARVPPSPSRLPRLPLLVKAHAGLTAEGRRVREGWRRGARAHPPSQPKGPHQRKLMPGWTFRRTPGIVCFLWALWGARAIHHHPQHKTLNLMTASSSSALSYRPSPGSSQGLELFIKFISVLCSYLPDASFSQSNRRKRM